MRTNVSTLTATFKQNHGIKNSSVINAINYFFTSIGNATPIGRWFGDLVDRFSAGFNSLIDSIKTWYNFEGGRELIKGVLVGVIEIAIGVLAIAATIAAVLAGGWTIALAAALVAGVIGVVNGITNIVNEAHAHGNALGGDPATARRRSELDTLQETLRSSFMFGADGEKYEYSKFYNNLALGIDVVSLVCTVVSVVSGCGKLLKNGYKWATGDAAKLKDIAWKNVFSKEAFTSFTSKFSQNLRDFRVSFRANGMQVLGDFGSRLLRDFGRNLKSEYFDFSDAKSKFSSIKNMLGIPKTLIKDGFNLGSLWDISINSILLPSLTFFTVNSLDATVVTEPSGQMRWDFTDKITVDSVKGLVESINKKILNSPVFSNDGSMNLDILSKLSSISNIKVSIPVVTIPDTEIIVMER